MKLWNMGLARAYLSYGRDWKNLTWEKFAASTFFLLFVYFIMNSFCLQHAWNLNHIYLRLIERSTCVFPILECIIYELIVQRVKRLLPSKSQNSSHCCSSTVTVASEVAMLWRKLVSGRFPKPNSYQLLNDFFFYLAWIVRLIYLGSAAGRLH